MTEDLAYRAGFDAGKNGPNTTNCHFSIFAERRFTDAWERGNADGKLKRVCDSGDSPKPQSKTT